MVVNHDVAAVRMASQMHFGHGSGRNGIEPIRAALHRVTGHALQAVVERIHINVVHVHQQAAASPVGQRSQKFRLAHVAGLPGNIG